jgi:hypothetical protein
MDDNIKYFIHAISIPDCQEFWLHGCNEKLGGCFFFLSYSVKELVCKSFIENLVNYMRHEVFNFWMTVRNVEAAEAYFKVLY